MLVRGAPEITKTFRPGMKVGDAITDLGSLIAMDLTGPQNNRGYIAMQLSEARWVQV